MRRPLLFLTIGLLSVGLAAAGALAQHADGVLSGLSAEDLQLARTLLLRLVSLVLGVWQMRQFTAISKDVIFRIRRALLLRLERVSMSALSRGSTSGMIPSSMPRSTTPTSAGSSGWSPCCANRRSSSSSLISNRPWKRQISCTASPWRSTASAVW